MSVLTDELHTFGGLCIELILQHAHCVVRGQEIIDPRFKRKILTRRGRMHNYCRNNIPVDSPIRFSDSLVVATH